MKRSLSQLRLGRARIFGEGSIRPPAGLHLYPEHGEWGRRITAKSARTTRTTCNAKVTHVAPGSRVWPEPERPPGRLLARTTPGKALDRRERLLASEAGQATHQRRREV